MEPVRPDLPAQLPEKYDAAIFFDNDHDQINNVKSFCQTIRLVKVQHTDNLRALEVSYDPRIFEDYKKSIPRPNYYIDFIEKTQRTIYYDPPSGLTESDFAILEEWINTLRNAEEVKNKAAIFDWDRTLSKFEGVALGFMEDFDWYAHDILKLPASVTEDQMMEDLLIYICGGHARLGSLRDMFVRLAKNGIDIIILTNNGGCQKPAFKFMINKLLPEGIQAYLACSSKAKFNGGKGHKGYKLYTIPQFKDDICTAPSNSNTNNSNNNSNNNTGNNNTMKGGKRRSNKRRSNKKRSKRRGKTRKNYL